MPLAVKTRAEDGDDAENVFDELGFSGHPSSSRRIVAQQFDSTLPHDVLEDLVAEPGESVSVCHRNASDISRQATSKNGSKTFPLPVEAASDVRVDFPARVLGTHVGDLAFEVVFLARGGHAAVADVDFLLRVDGRDDPEEITIPDETKASMTTWERRVLYVAARRETPMRRSFASIRCSVSLLAESGTNMNGIYVYVLL